MKTADGVAWQAPAAGDPGTGIAALATFGDSITAAGKGGGIKWHELVSDWLGIPAFNPSVHGEAPADIAVRQGGLAPALTLTGNAIPATADPVTVTAISPSSGFIADAPGNAFRGAFVGRLCGVAGTLKHDQSTGVGRSPGRLPAPLRLTAQPGRRSASTTPRRTAATSRRSGVAATAARPCFPTPRAWSPTSTHRSDSWLCPS